VGKSFELAKAAGFCPSYPWNDVLISQRLRLLPVKTCGGGRCYESEDGRSKDVCDEDFAMPTV
jgi:hypothetical protein